MTTLNVKEKQKDLAPVPSHVAGEVEHCPPYAHDAVFGELNEDGPNYRNVGWSTAPAPGPSLCKSMGRKC